VSDDTRMHEVMDKKREEKDERKRNPICETLVTRHFEERREG